MSQLSLFINPNGGGWLCPYFFQVAISPWKKGFGVFLIKIYKVEFTTAAAATVNSGTLLMPQSATITLGCDHDISNVEIN